MKKFSLFGKAKYEEPEEPLYEEGFVPGEYAPEAFYPEVGYTPQETYYPGEEYGFDGEYEPDEELYPEEEIYSPAFRPGAFPEPEYFEENGVPEKYFGDGVLPEEVDFDSFIEEFSFEEPGEPEETEDDPAPAEESPAPETPAPRDIYESYVRPPRRPMLLSRRGGLLTPGWNTKDLFEYNKEDMGVFARRNEWELYQLFNERFAFRACYGHAGSRSLTDVTLVDFASGERFSFGNKQAFAGDSLDLDFSGGQPHSLKYEDDAVFLSISFDGDVRRIQARAKNEELEADLSCHEDGDAIVTAVPFPASRQFSYNYKRVFMDLSGHISLHNGNQKLTGDTFLMLSSSRGIGPRRQSRLWGSGGQETDEGILALNLANGYGRDDAPTENAIFVDGELDKLREVYFRFNTADLMRTWRIGDEERRLKLSFKPFYDDHEHKNRLLFKDDVHRLYGRLNGTVELRDGEVRDIRDMLFTVCYETHK